VIPTAPWLALASYIQRKAGPAIGAPSVPNRPWRTHVPDATRAKRREGN
jgi:hypothetical protein